MLAIQFEGNCGNVIGYDQIIKSKIYVSQPLTFSQFFWRISWTCLKLSKSPLIVNRAKTY